jgi:hypothetical protein
MNPNNDQLMSWLRSTIAIVSGMAITAGYGNSETWATVGGVILLLVPFVWGTFVHTDAAKIAQVAALPDVAKIISVPSPNPESAVAIAVDDRNQPKVTNSIGVSLPNPTAASAAKKVTI